jgi:hypothetical protein
MENEKTFTRRDLIIGAIGIVILGALYSIHDHSFVWIILYGVLALGIIIACILSLSLWKSTEAIESDICKRLEKAGYRYEMKEGDLFVFKSDNRFEVHLADSFNKRIKHLYILYKFKDDSFDKVNTNGWSRAANIINVRNTNTIFVALEDHLCCCYQSSIGNSKDFMNEFNVAYQSVVEVMEDYGKLVPLLERDYPSNTDNQSTIGFKQN